MSDIQRIADALDQYPGWEDSSIGYALKNSPSTRNVIARHVAKVLGATHTAERIYPEPGASRWQVCYRGGGPTCRHCIPPAARRCPENRDPSANALYYACKRLGDHTMHDDGHGTFWETTP